MRLDRELPTSGPVVSGIVAGGFKVDDGVYRALLMTPVRADGWSPPPLEELVEADVASVLAGDPAPEFLLLGTGPSLRRPSPLFTQALAARGIGLEIMDSRAAARAWVVLRNERRWISAALYPLV